MRYKRLFIWVEGDDDIRFFDRIIKPVFEKKYNFVEVRACAQLKKKKIANFIKSIKAMKADYIYVADINNSPCITAKKQKIKNIEQNRIIIVIKEIESWYLAGLSSEDSEKFKIRPFKTTDNVNKEAFDKLRPKSFDSRLDFMLEILKYFSIEIAKEQNQSFKYFIKKYKLAD